MSFKKINAKEKIEKAIEKNPELERLIKVEEDKYNLIKKAVEHREFKGMYQKDVAKISGLTQQMVSRIEKITNSPTLDNFMNYLDAVGLKIELIEK